MIDGRCGPALLVPGMGEVRGRPRPRAQAVRSGQDDPREGGGDGREDGELAPGERADHVDVRLAREVGDEPASAVQDREDDEEEAVEARSALEDPRIELTDSTRWDIAGGGISEQLLSTMLAMAEQARFSVTVVATGHPPQVWATDRLSNHAKGRGRRLGDRRAGRRRAAGGGLGRPSDGPLPVRSGGAGAREPWAFDGYGGRSFTDLVHQDHLHVGFDA